MLASNDLFSRCFMFYGRYVDNTLVVIKSGDLNGVHNALNDFDPNIKFTLDTFDDVVPHVLDMEVHLDGNLELGIYCKPTNTGQYTYYTNYKTAWIPNIHRPIVNYDETKI